MADPQIRLQEMIAKLKDLNFRLTPQRLAVLKILAASKNHPSVERTYEKVEKDLSHYESGHHLQNYCSLKRSK